ncbi:hypothetical protein L484_020473 [Morus notabilis]|uniref:Aspartic proteinase nepenthesin-2 n=1 Tax=Morus notabilis TaxID=981085 RepID=W9SBK7_9ROSA|nr:hypothetical protein L484_020473 [Morus notabilis]
MKPAKTILPLLFLFLISFSILLPCGKATTSNNNGFSIKLIPRDSPESPFFPGKSLTHKDRMKRLVNHSNVRLQHYVTHPSTVRLPMMSLKGILFMAKVGIGTLPSTPTSPPQKSLFLLIDTGNTLFASKANATAKPALMQENTRMIPRRKEFLPQRLSLSVRIGLMFPETIKGLVFGCGNDNKNFHFSTSRDNPIAGILAMGWGKHSFAKQIKSQILNRFSYCLVPGPYYLDLRGITIANTVKIPHAGECAMDSGAAISHIRRETYVVLSRELEKIFFSSNLTKIQGEIGLDLCYKAPSNLRIDQYPRIKLNFRNADLDISIHGTYIFEETESGQRLFCLAMMPTDMGQGKLSIIGAFQQVDHRFIFDTRAYNLYFAPKDCAASGA